MSLIVDVLCSNEMLEKFCKFYNIEISEDVNKIFRAFIGINSKTDAKTENKIFNGCLSSININDKINISYFPYSQKYIDYYDEQRVSGTVIFIDEQTDNLFLMSINVDDATHAKEYVFKSLERDGCSYLGTSRGYDYCISQITN